MTYQRHFFPLAVAYCIATNNTCLSHSCCSVKGPFVDWTDISRRTPDVRDLSLRGFTVPWFMSTMVLMRGLDNEKGRQEYKWQRHAERSCGRAPWHLLNFAVVILFNSRNRETHVRCCSARGFRISQTLPAYQRSCPRIPPRSKFMANF